MAGQVSFHQQGNLLQITNSPNAIINWQSFSIGANEITRFVQGSASSAVLNRVAGPDPSSILGALQSNGRVFLINPSEVLTNFATNAGFTQDDDNPTKLQAEDIAHAVQAALEMNDRGFTVELTVFATNPKD